MKDNKRSLLILQNLQKASSNGESRAEPQKEDSQLQQKHTQKEWAQPIISNLTQ